MFEHFAFSDNLTFSACMHCSSFHRGGTSFHCCLSQHLFFFNST